MPASDPVGTVARQWAQKAEGDLLNAIHTLKIVKNCPTDTACFHAQQCVEKYLKSVLVLRGVDFPRTHSIRALMEMLPVGLRPKLEVIEQDQLTEYAITTRYPGDYEPIGITDARRAVDMAKRVRLEIRNRHPELQQFPRRSRNE